MEIKDVYRVSPAKRLEAVGRIFLENPPRFLKSMAELIALPSCPAKVFVNKMGSVGPSMTQGILWTFTITDYLLERVGNRSALRNMLLSQQVTFYEEQAAMALADYEIYVGRTIKICRKHDHVGFLQFLRSIDLELTDNQDFRVGALIGMELLFRIEAEMMAVNGLTLQQRK
jgi:hypothetical protein